MLDEIWADDLFGRRADADAIQTFLIERSHSLKGAGRRGAYTLAVDGDYGTGKSYLLQRLFQQVRLEHPAAFIDAWADDTIDSPWTALLVSLEEALEPYAARFDADTRSALRARGVKFITALAKGAAKKGASYIVGEDGFDDAVDAVFERNAEEQIDNFKARKKAVGDLKSSLTEALEKLNSQGVCQPLFIFIDELDRCRPTYAISFLEEIKHVFDISGVVFVLAVNSQQLAKSVSAIYGSEFDSKKYLQRFIEKRYQLNVPDLEPLIALHAKAQGLDFACLEAPGEGAGELRSLRYISQSLGFWDLPARDAIRVVDGLVTACAIWPHKVPLRLELLLPLIVMLVMDWTREDLKLRINPRRVPVWYFPGKNANVKQNPLDLYELFRANKGRDFYYFQDDSRRQGVLGAVARVMDAEHTLRAPLDLRSKTLLGSYASLVKSIAHFSAVDSDPIDSD